MTTALSPATVTRLEKLAFGELLEPKRLVSPMARFREGSVDIRPKRRARRARVERSPSRPQH
jgi:hypothetical protein